MEEFATQRRKVERHIAAAVGEVVVAERKMREKPNEVDEAKERHAAKRNALRGTCVAYARRCCARKAGWRATKEAACSRG